MRQKQTTKGYGYDGMSVEQAHEELRKIRQDAAMPAKERYERQLALGRILGELGERYI